MNNSYNEKNVRIWTKWMKFGKSLGCHQKHERSFFYKGYQFPVCSRCTGVILGQFLAIILILFKIYIPQIYALSFLVIMFIDWLIQALKIYESNNTRRVITGFIAGIGLMYMYFYIAKFILFEYIL